MLRRWSGYVCQFIMEAEDSMFESDTIPVIIGAIVVLAILIPNILLVITFRKYKQAAKALPNPYDIKQTQPEAIDEKRSALAAQLLDNWSAVPEPEKEITRDAVWTAMLLEAASDGNIDHREMTFVADLFGRMAGDEMDFRPVINAAEQVHNDRKAALAEIAKAKAVSNPSKEQILASAFLVSVSDHSLSEAETDCLGDIAAALAINRRDRKTMLRGITQRFGV